MVKGGDTFLVDVLNPLFVLENRKDKMCWELSPKHVSMICFKSKFFGLVEEVAKERTEWVTTLDGKASPDNS